ncbi:hypothetical protein [Bacillus sp. RAR_GA_16]|uniref:hypothetical protein n=1 Tax=Bacillus sp. RAR_GA_16 TaxID=2876774 RepID=UPI001CC9A091|nr:hypothetical protein [Bacillus sp. RAR_GA_16]MCA0171990.1 hypothetical protein [Bacillus sp. RAR_GA_16]
MQVTQDHMLKRATGLKENQEVVISDAVAVEIMTQPVVQLLLAVLDTARTFVAVYFL